MPRLHIELRPNAHLVVWLFAGTLVFASFPLATAWAVTATIVERGLLDCFPAGLSAKEGRAIVCETSAVVKSGDELIFATDNHVPGRRRSSVFALAGGKDGIAAGDPRYLTESAIKASGKLEAMTVTPDREIFFAATAFDRIRPDSAKRDAYNMLLAWPAGRAQPVQIVAASKRGGVTSSLAVRHGLTEALATPAFPSGPPYFKVEGLAALPDGRLLFGIRAMGKSKEAFELTVKIVSVSYEVRDGHVSLGEDITLVYDFDAAALPAMGTKEVGLSSLEYDSRNDRLYLLTSFENEHKGSKRVTSLGGFLWTLSIAGLDAGKPPTLALQSDGHPLVFAHKSEGLAVIDGSHIFVVHDDDRELGCENAAGGEPQVCRQPHQAAYTVVRIGQASD